VIASFGETGHDPIKEAPIARDHKIASLRENGSQPITECRQEASPAVADQLLERSSRWPLPGWPLKPSRRRGMAKAPINGCIRMRSAMPAIAVTGVVILALCASYTGAAAQDTAAQDAAHRAALLMQLPADAAQRVFGGETTPASGPPQAIGAYERGCLAGAVALPADGPNWQVMRPSRDRAWGHPVLIAFIEKLAAQMPRAAGWPGLLIGDIAQPRGGPMLTGHGSHQIGLDADIWLTPMPTRRLSRTERDEMSATDVVAPDGRAVDPAVWNRSYLEMYRTVASAPQVARIFVNPAIKRELCREAGSDRAWLAKIRPWWGHDYHFHMRLLCPPGEPQCVDQTPPPPGDGCGKELAWWFTPEALHPPPSHAKPLLMSNLPQACLAVAGAPADATVAAKPR
jgi:penicillin-insensitive murein DD-endopeptidase